VTAVLDNITTDNVAETIHSTNAASVPSKGPAVHLTDIQEVCSGSLKRSSDNKMSNAKKQKTSEMNSTGTTTAGSRCTDSNEAIVVSSSLTSDGNHSTESSSVDSREDRCLLDTSTGVLLS